jgi:hypothetical protein
MSAALKTYGMTTGRCASMFARSHALIGPASKMPPNDRFRFASSASPSMKRVATPALAMSSFR